MAAFSGRQLFFEIDLSNSPLTPNWVKIGGLQTKKFGVKSELVEITNDDSTLSREYLAGAGTTDLTFEGEGVWKDDASNRRIIQLAINRQSARYRITWPGVGTFTGPYIPESVEGSGTTKAETRATYRFVPAGDIVAVYV